MEYIKIMVTILKGAVRTGILRAEKNSDPEMILPIMTVKIEAITAMERLRRPGTKNIPPIAIEVRIALKPLSAIYWLYCGKIKENPIIAENDRMAINNIVLEKKSIPAIINAPVISSGLKITCPIFLRNILLKYRKLYPWNCSFIKYSGLLTSTVPVIIMIHVRRTKGMLRKGREYFWKKVAVKALRAVSNTENKITNKIICKLFMLLYKLRAIPKRTPLNPNMPTLISLRLSPSL